MGFKIAILTDHATHTASNSVYGITKALLQHPEIEKVDVISRGDSRNADFFAGIAQPDLWALQASRDFSFPADRLFKETFFKTQLNQYDFILLRLPRPFTNQFCQYLVECFPESKIINRPAGIVKTGNKKYLLTFPEFTPPIKICHSIADIVSFKSEFPIVLKPFEEYGGKGIIKIDKEVVWLGNFGQISFSDFAKQYAQKPVEYLGMKFLKNVSNGDKRIVVANGKVLASSLRIPGKGMWLCNIAQGGSSKNAAPDEREMEIIRHISPVLKKEGIFNYGLDTLEDDNGVRVVSEINTLSVGGITPAEENSGLPITKFFAEEFVNYIKEITD